MELYMRDNFREFLDTLRLEINDVKGHDIVFEVPQVNAEVIGRNEVLPVGTGAECVDVVVVAVLELLALHAFEALTDDL